MEPLPLGSLAPGDPKYRIQALFMSTIRTMYLISSTNSSTSLFILI